PARARRLGGPGGAVFSRDAAADVRVYRAGASSGGRHAGTTRRPSRVVGGRALDLCGVGPAPQSGAPGRRVLAGGVARAPRLGPVGAGDSLSGLSVRSG